MIRTTTIAAAAALTLAGAAGAADHSITLDVSDVDFSNPAEVSALYDRIVETAETICERMYLDPTWRTVNYPTRVELKNACVTASVDSAIAKSGRAPLMELSAAYQDEPTSVASN